MANVGRNKRGQIVIRAYAGVNPDTKRDRTISVTLEKHATEEEIEAAKEKLDAKAAVLKQSSEMMTISSALDYYLAGCELSTMSPTTLASYHSYANKHVKPRIGAVFFDKATAATFSQFYRELRKPIKDGGAGLSSATVEKIHAMLSGCFRKLKADGNIPSNPMIGITVARSKTAEIQPLMPDDFGKLVGYLQDVFATPVSDDDSFMTYMYAVLIWTALHTGLRRGELAGLQTKHYVSRSKGKGLRVARVLIQVRTNGADSVSEKDPKSAHGKRFVTVDDRTAQVIDTYRSIKHAVLAEHRVLIDRDTAFFCHANGFRLAPSEITDAFREVCNELKLSKGVHLHTLRHTHASYLIDRGVSLKDIQERLGHASIKTTGDIYGHLLPGRDGEVAHTFGDITQGFVNYASTEPTLYAPICPRTGQTCERFAPSGKEEGKPDKDTSFKT